MSAVLDPVRTRRGARAAAGSCDAVSLGEALTDLAAWTDLCVGAVERSVFSEPAMAAAAAGTIEPADWTAVRAFGPDRIDALILVRPARAAPLVGPRVLDAFHSHYGPRTPPMLRAGVPDAADRLLDAVAAEGRVLRLENQALRSLATTALVSAAERRGGGAIVVGAHARALLDAAGSAERATGPSLAGRRLRELDRQLRRLGAVTHRVDVEPGPLGAALEAFIELERMGWKGHRGTSLSDDSRRLSFARRLMATLAADERARADRLEVDGRTVAVVLTLFAGDTGFFWKIAHDPTLAHASPGVQVARMATAGLIADPAVRQVDSLAVPGHPLMDRLWSGRIEIGTVFLALDADAVPTAQRAGAAHLAHQRLRGYGRRLAARLIR
ncbi:MAG TPA: GNAT family N-acetyltransferase [Methylomirabilota bacterium]|nr:GNAT family N-acetyltransferase [Methylomirabilota bacterium]